MAFKGVEQSMIHVITNPKPIFFPKNRETKKHIDLITFEDGSILYFIKSIIKSMAGRLKFKDGMLHVKSDGIIWTYNDVHKKWYAKINDDLHCRDQNWTTNIIINTKQIYIPLGIKFSGNLQMVAKSLKHYFDNKKKSDDIVIELGQKYDKDTIIKWTSESDKLMYKNLYAVPIGSNNFIDTLPNEVIHLIIEYLYKSYIDVPYNNQQNNKITTLKQRRNALKQLHEKITLMTNNIYYLGSLSKNFYKIFSGLLNKCNDPQCTKYVFKLQWIKTNYCTHHNTICNNCGCELNSFCGLCRNKTNNYGCHRNPLNGHLEYYTTNAYMCNHKNNSYICNDCLLVRHFGSHFMEIKWIDNNQDQTFWIYDKDGVKMARVVITSIDEKTYEEKIVDMCTSTIHKRTVFKEIFLESKIPKITTIL